MPETPARPSRLLDYEEAAWYLNHSPRWVRSKLAARELTAVKIGRSVRFRIEDLDAYIETHRIESSI